ncbi:ribonuclease H-like domain-containing protein [Tanacetum coccineum]
MTTSNALVSCDGSGYDWSDQAEEGPTNFALMAYSSTSSNSEVSTDSNCSSSCLENVKILKEQNEQLLKDLRTSKLNVIAYKTGLESVEARLLVYKKNESVYEEDIKIVDKCKIGLGYNAVPPPYTRNFMPPKPDLLFSGLEEFTSEPIVIKHLVENSEAKASEAKPKAVRENNGAPIIEDWVSYSEEENVSQTKIENKTAKPRSNFEMFNKACYVCGSFDHLQVDCKKVNQKQFQNTKPIWNNAQRVKYQNFAKKTHPCAKKNIVPRAVLMKSGLVSVNTGRQANAAHTKTIVNAARPMSYLSKIAHSTVKRPIHKNTTFKNSNFNQRVNTVKDKNVNTVRPKAVVNAARPKAVVNDVKGNNVNAVKASACWVYKPKTKVLDHGNPQMDLQDKGVIDSGCSRHMTGNMSYLADFEEIDEGYVAFGGNPKGGKITGKGSGPNWLFDIDALTKSMNYKPVVAGNQSNDNAGTKACDDTGKARMETVPGKDYIMLPLWIADPPFSQSLKSSPDAGFKPSGDDEKKVTEELGKEGGDPSKEDERDDQEKDACDNSTNNVNAASTNKVNVVDDDEDVGAEADMNDLDAFMPVSTIPTTRVHKDHPVEQIIRELNSTPQTRRMTQNLEEHDGCQECFFYGKIKEEIYDCQPPGFEDPNFSDRVYKVEKALYGLHQAPRAWCETLSTYLLDNGFQRGKIDKTLFIRRDKGDILLVQVYVDDIIFGSTKKSLCTEFGENKNRKRDFWATVKAKTVNGEVQLQALVDGKKIIITESIVRRDLQLEDAEGIDCLPNATIFEQLTLMGYEKVSQKLTFYKAFFSPQWKFLIHTVLQCLSAKTTAWNEFSSTMASAIICLATNQKFNFSKYIFESMVKNLENVSDNVADEAVNEETDDSLERAVTTATSLDAEHARGTSSSGGPKCQETIRDTNAQTRSEKVSKHSNDPLLVRGNTLQSGEDRPKLEELVEFCTKLQQRVLDLENTKTAQD